LTRVKEQLAKYNDEYPDFPMMVSLGVATAEENNLTDALMIADQRMYADKAEHSSSADHDFTLYRTRSQIAPF